MADSQRRVAAEPLGPGPGLGQVLSEEDAGVSWMQRALCEERQEVERLLARRHEDILLRLQRMPTLTAQGQPRGQPTQQPRSRANISGALKGDWDVAKPAGQHSALRCQDVVLLPPEVPAPAQGPALLSPIERQQPPESAAAGEEGGGSPATERRSEQGEQSPSKKLLSALVVAEEAQPCDASPRPQERKNTGSSNVSGQRSNTGKLPSVEEMNVHDSAAAAEEWVIEKDPALCVKVREEAEASDSAMARDYALRVRDCLSGLLDLVSGVVVCLFIFLMAVWTEYRSFDLALNLVEVEGFEDSRPGRVMWPHASGVFDALEWGFGLFFCLELALRIAFRIRLRTDIMWNTMDALIITAFWVERLGENAFTTFNPAALRLARFFRLLRLLKLVRHVHSFDALLFITKAISSSMQVLSWTVAVLALLMMVVAMVNASVLEDFIKDETKDVELRREVFQRWGSFIRAFVSMFEITLANWGPQCWMLMNSVGEFWGFFFIAWRCCVGFAVIQVISSVFIQHTFKVANRDEDVMIQEKQKAHECYLGHLDRLFTRLDESGDGLICREEFEVALEEPRVRHWFGALEIDVSDVPKLFLMLGDGDGHISKDEFIVGLKKLKGPAQSADMVQVVKDCQRIRVALGDASLVQHRTFLADIATR